MTTEPTAASNSNITEQPTAPETEPPATPTIAPSVAAPSAEAPAWTWKADYVIFALLLVLTFFLASFTASNSDLWLNLAIGQRLSAGTLDLGVDPFSWASEGEWVHQSWLFSWLLFQLYEQVGGEGLVFIKALMMVAAVALLSRVGWRESSRWFTLIGLAMAVLAMSARLALQPIVVSLLFLSLTLYVLHRAGVFTLRKDPEYPTCPRWLWALPVLCALWANLDAWFVLGPMIVGLCWLASGLARFVKAEAFGCERAGLVSGTTLGLFFGLSLAACLLNPFHVRAFQLPPELAYLAVSITDSVGVSLPDAVAAGGRALAEIRRTDPDMGTWTISSVSPEFWGRPERGLNAASLALYPLFLLGLLAFTLASLIRPMPNAPTLHLSRFLIWLVFGVMALALYRLIPFFVIVAAPLTALTLGEFLQWQQDSAAVAVGQRDRGLNLARFVTVPFMLLLLFFAWPGWLHGTNEFNSSRRVAWQIRPEPSHEQTALALQALKDKGECRNVFNTSYDLGNHLAWFAPGVKYGMDTRFPLFASAAADYAKARQALGNPNRPDADWQAIFEAHDIDQAAVYAILKSGAFFKYWLHADHWRQRYIDNRTLLASWRGPQATWPIDQLPKDLNRLAFGLVPADQRPPKNGAPSPQSLNFSTLYADGFGPQPIGVGQFMMLQREYKFQSDIFHLPLKDGGPVGILSFVSVSMPNDMPGAFTLPSLVVLVTGWRTYPPDDFGPPALPILMVRAARRAVAENPYDLQAQAAIRDANENLRRNQEDRWVNFDPRGPHPAKLRDRIRQIQLGASLYNAVQLAPEQFDANEKLANFYLQQDMVDLALEYKKIAEKGLEVLRSDPKFDTKKLDASIQKYQESVKTLENAVKVRVSKWREVKDKMPPLAQANYAFRGTFQDLINDRPVEVTLGLGKTALDVLFSLNVEQLKGDQAVASVVLRYELLLAMGRADIVYGELKDERIRKVLPGAIWAQYLLLAAGAVGDYESMDLGTKELQSAVADAIRQFRLNCYPSVFVIPTCSTFSTIGTFAMTQLMSRSLSELHLQHNELCNIITLRGIFALETGDTKKAQAFFQAALDQAGTEYGFSEQPIAQRYLELLKEQHR